jgi:3-methyl-2-oxobutanoate hydroxymethyltransferase
VAITVRDLARWKSEGRKFAMLTAYDWPTAKLVEEAGVPVILVGDSVGDNVLGYPNTLPVTMDEILHHARAVARGAPNTLLIGDLPFGAYQGSRDDAIRNAASFLKAGMHAAKLEGGGWTTELVAAMTERGIPVMGHLGLTPQSVNVFGGMRAQARTDDARRKLLDDACALQEAGGFAIVLEGMPREAAATVTAALRIPTIGIGAGPDCDGQVLITHDLLGISKHTRGGMPKFAKAFAEVGDSIVGAMRDFSAEVTAGRFPDDAHSYH